MKPEIDMLGLVENSWMLDLFGAKKFASNTHAGQGNGAPEIYTTYFGLGHAIRLEDSPQVFKVSLAGMALGALLLRELSNAELGGRIWDIGTGSGVLAFLLRGMGATRLTASDFYPEAIELAKKNERLNFDSPAVCFQVRDLFSDPPGNCEKHDLIVFNPPGWRTPSARFMEELNRTALGGVLPPGAMFHGDQLLRRFLNELPANLAPGGRAIVGMNSLVGIQNVINGHKSDCSGESPLAFRLVERHSLPLLFYSPAWQKAERLLREEFALWRDCHGSAYTQDAQGRIYWSYEVVECRLADRLV